MTNNTENITSEKNLWEIYKSFRNIPQRPFNRVVTGIVGFVLGAFSLGGVGHIYDFISITREITQISISAALSVLSLLVAAFAIYASLSDKSLFLVMSEYNYPNTKISYLKYTIFSFMHVFILFIILTLGSVLISIFCCKGCLVPVILRNINGRYIFPANLTDMTVRIGFWITGTYFVYTILVLKSFIFNIYHMFMTSIRYELENNE